MKRNLLTSLIFSIGLLFGCSDNKNLDNQTKQVNTRIKEYQTKASMGGLSGDKDNSCVLYFMPQSGVDGSSLWKPVPKCKEFIDDFTKTQGEFMITIREKTEYEIMDFKK